MDRRIRLVKNMKKIYEAPTIQLYILKEEKGNNEKWQEKGND